MRKFFAPAAMLLLLLSIAVPAYSQGLYSNVSGSVTDRSGALIPGVTIMATNVDQGTVATTVTNEAGVYNYGDLLPGRYTISASLPGFQTKTLTDVNLSQNTTYRYNFELAVASVNTQLEVSIPADTILAAQGATVRSATAVRSSATRPSFTPCLTSIRTGNALLTTLSC